MVQHTAAKFISNTYHKKGEYKPFSISKILCDLNLETLEERRNQARLTMAYKIINGLVILDDQMLPKANHRLSRPCNAPNVGFKNQLLESQTNLKITGNTFFFNTPKLWNCRVTPSQANAPSVEAFQQYFKRK